MTTFSGSGRLIRTARLVSVCVLILLAARAVQAAEPLAGRWLLVSQDVSGKKTTEDLTLRVNPSGKAFEFAYSVPVHDIQFVSLRFIARLDGTLADVTNANGQKIGTVKVTRSGASQYRIVLQGDGRPTASGTMTVSADGKTLRSESESSARGQTMHTLQIFARQ